MKFVGIGIVAQSIFPCKLESEIFVRLAVSRIRVKRKYARVVSDVQMIRTEKRISAK